MAAVPQRHRFALLAAAAAVLAAGASAQGPPDDLAVIVSAHARPYVGQGFAPGFVVGVVREGEELVLGFGETAPGSGEAPDGATLYEVGSITKLYTGLLLADAHLAGIARIEDPLAKHLPPGVAVPNVGAEPIRLGHLSTHTSGLARLPSNLRTQDADPYARFGAEELYAALAAARPQRPPGERYAYSNFAVGALGHALVLAHGAESFEHLLRDRVAAPLGAGDTVIALDAEHEARLAPPCDTALEPGERWHFDALAGAGAIRASVADLLAFARLHHSGAEHALAPAARLAARVHATPAEGPPMGLGWHHAGDLGAARGVIAHEGQTGGYHSVLLVEPERGRAVAILSNAPSGFSSQLAASILRSLAGEAVAPAVIAPRVPLDERALAELPGTYRFGAFDKAVVTARDGALFLKRSMRDAVRLNRVGEDRYDYRVVDGAVEVRRDAEGAVSGITVVHGDAREEASRVE